MVKIRWLSAAREDLRDIYEYISRDSKRYAQLQIDKIFTRTFILKTHIQAEKLWKKSINRKYEKLQKATTELFTE